MPMSSREVVRRAIEFERPERMPLRLRTLGLSDVHHVNWNQIGTGNRCVRQTRDEWGCLWVRTETQNMGQVKGHPLLDWQDLHAYHWPDPNNPALFAGMEEQFAGSHIVGLRRP